jgi:hypothetical protein
MTMHMLEKTMRRLGFSLWHGGGNTKNGRKCKSRPMAKG